MSDYLIDVCCGKCGEIHPLKYKFCNPNKHQFNMCCVCFKCGCNNNIRAIKFGDNILFAKFNIEYKINNNFCIVSELINKKSIIYHTYNNTYVAALELDTLLPIDVTEEQLKIYLTFS